jgi:hypothetical protein
MTKVIAAIALLLLASPLCAQQKPPERSVAPGRIAGHTGIVRPQASGTTSITFGLNGHDGRAYYPLSEVEQRMQWMQANHLTIWRTDVGATSFDILDKVVPLAKKYGITVRPMLYPASQAQTYTIAKRYAADIKIWEIGNEQDAPRDGAQDRINAMLPSVKGVEQAEAELRTGLKTTINIMSCNDEGASQCQGDPNGDVWFLDMAKASGWNFNYVSFHYYPRSHDSGHWMDKYLGQARTASKKFGVPVFFNEVNCGEIYDGDTTGGPTCVTALTQALNEVITKYADVFQEVVVYEMLDQPDMAGVERYFGVCYVVGNCKPTAATVAQFGAMSSGGTTPPEPPITPPTTPPNYTGTVSGTLNGTFTGTVNLTPVKP